MSKTKVFNPRSVNNHDRRVETFSLILEGNKRYAHTAPCKYRITMASLQPDDRRLPHCICGNINQEKQSKSKNEDKVFVIVEHDLNEYILCILDNKKLRQCKVDLLVRAGEQIAFRTIGKTPVMLAREVYST